MGSRDMSWERDESVRHFYHEHYQDSFITAAKVGYSDADICQHGQKDITQLHILIVFETLHHHTSTELERKFVDLSDADTCIHCTCACMSQV